MSSISSHRRARTGSASSTDSKSSHRSHGRNASRTRARSSVVRREGPRYPQTERGSSPHPQSPVSDHQSQQEGSFASNRASFGGSSHDSRFISENESDELETQSHETSSQCSYSHLGYFSHDCMMISHYDSQLTIEEDPNEEYYSYQSVAQHVTRGLATENSIQAPNVEYHSLQAYSPATEMWTLQESRDERIRLGLPGRQQAPSAFFECDQKNAPEADNPN
ncbi:faa69f4e-320e-4b87-80e4-958c28384ee7 [Sclerotinia trifoliorum]|uniref:Faa69f4e-320e-4b87-80e4-958c28384ee7 n=1 Tax=Sclerotinia trifoliorum TaxID=28548 RepID=A0A8H2ZU82_9HELO|nr:faa69f4e-320e-4b87-80e4-958c28384ee7 [Sclerotinia trifoliorum]